MLKALHTSSIATCGSLSTLEKYVQSLSESPFILVALLAKAVSHKLRSHSQEGLTDKEAEYIRIILHKISQDYLMRRYYSSIILQALQLSCFHPVNVPLFVRCGIVDTLQTLMDISSNSEAGDVVANILWKILSNDEINAENSEEVVADTTGT